MINENLQICGVGCVNGLGIFSGKNKELLHFVELDQINIIDLYFDNSIILISKTKNESESESENPNEEITYKLVQLKKDDNDENNYQYKNTIIKSDNLFNNGINAMKCLNNGIIIIGDKNNNLQIWH